MVALTRTFDVELTRRLVWWVERMCAHGTCVAGIAFLIVMAFALATWRVADDIVVAPLEAGAAVTATDGGMPGAIVIVHDPNTHARLSAEVLEAVEERIRYTFNVSSRWIIGPLTLPGALELETQPPFSATGRNEGFSELHRMLYSRERGTAAFIVSGLSWSSDAVARAGSAIEEVLGPQYRVAVGGEESLQREVTRCLLDDLLRLSALSVLFLSGVLLICYRSVRLVVVVALEVALSCILLTCFLLVTGFGLSMLIVLLPIVAITSGASDDIYYLDRVLHHVRNGADIKNACGQSAKDTAGPISVAATVSCLALASLCFSGVPALTEFAIAGCLAVTISVILTFTVLPALANVLKINVLPRRRPWFDEMGPRRSITRSTRAYRAIGVTVVGVAVVSGTLALNYIKVDDSWLENLPPGPTRELIDVADATLAGGTLLQAKVYFSLTRQQRAREILSWTNLRQNLLRHYHVGAVWSPLDEAIRLTGVGGLVKDADTLADLPALANSLMVQAADTNGSAESTATALIAMKYASVHAVVELRHEIEKWAKASGVRKVAFEGRAWAQAAAIARVAKSMTWSNVATMVIVTVLLSWLCGSWTLGVWSGLCVGFAVSIIHLYLYLVDARLNLAGAIFGPLVVGFAINSILRLAVEQRLLTTSAGRSQQISASSSSLRSSIKGGAVAIAALVALLFASMVAAKDLALFLIAGIVLSIGAAQVCFTSMYAGVRQ